ncbi:hypothetical protein ASD55_07320 [Rhodanobacter sp. Root561]|nr:hypothetical protein ASD55_07320 [Rhodanobacter sp. Root561]
MGDDTGLVQVEALGEFLFRDPQPSDGEATGIGVLRHLLGRQLRWRLRQGRSSGSDKQQGGE